MDRSYTVEEKFEKYFLFLILPPAIVLLARLGSPKLLKIFALIVLVMGHLLLALKFTKYKRSGNRKGILNIIVWEITFTLTILGIVLAFAWEEKPLGIAFIALGVVGMVVALFTRVNGQRQ
jgi:hypothetical protein